MSIYATLWWLEFPRYGDDHIGCEWTRVSAQGVPAHIVNRQRPFGKKDRQVEVAAMLDLAARAARWSARGAGQ
jgi:hypothetical protein